MRLVAVVSGAGSGSKAATRMNPWPGWCVGVRGCAVGVPTVWWGSGVLGAVCGLPGGPGAVCALGGEPGWILGRG